MAKIIRIENISKRYRLGTHRSRGYRTLRESIRDAVAMPIRRMAGWGSGSSPHDGSKLLPSTEDLWALQDVSFEVSTGEVVGIIGRNGAGKSTLLKILSKITQPTSGQILLRGRVSSLLEVGTGFHPELTGRENIYLNGAVLGMSRAEINRKFDEIAGFAEIEQFLDTPVKRYSSGMYVRLAFAVAAHLEPEILVVDEVLAVGDMEFQRKCMGRMGQVARSGRTVLFVSHNMAAVQNLCQKAALLSKGRLASFGECAEVLRSYLADRPTANQNRQQLASFRSTGKTQIIQDFAMENADGQPTDCFPCGTSVTFRFTYRSPFPLINPIFSIRVETPMGQRLFYLSTRSQYGPVASLAEEGEICCQVPVLPLLPGAYLLSLFCVNGRDGNDWDALERAVTLNVEASDFFGTGHLPLQRTGCVVVPATWSFSNGALVRGDLDSVASPQLQGVE